VFGNGTPKAFCGSSCVILIALWQHDQDLLATKTSNNVYLSEGGLRNIGDSLQH